MCSLAFEKKKKSVILFCLWDRLFSFFWGGGVGGPIGSTLIARGEF